MDYKYFLLLILIGILLILYMNANLNKDISNKLEGGNILKNINNKTSFFTISLNNNISLEKFIELNEKYVNDNVENVTEKMIENKKIEWTTDWNNNYKITDQSILNNNKLILEKTQLTSGRLEIGKIVSSYPGIYDPPHVSIWDMNQTGDILKIINTKRRPYTIAFNMDKSVKDFNKDLGTIEIDEDKGYTLVIKKNKNIFTISFLTKPNDTTPAQKLYLSIKNNTLIATKFPYSHFLINPYKLNLLNITNETISHYENLVNNFNYNKFNLNFTLNMNKIVLPKELLFEHFSTKGENRLITETVDTFSIVPVNWIFSRHPNQEDYEAPNLFEGITLTNKHYLTSVPDSSIAIPTDTTTDSTIDVTNTITVDIAKAVEEIITNNSKQKNNFSSVYSGNYITKSIKNTNTVQPANTLWKIVRLKAHMKDANGNDIYKYNIINSGTRKSLINNIELTTKNILNPTKQEVMFSYKNTDIFDKLMLDLEPVKNEAGILQKDSNNNQKYFIKFTILDGTVTKYKYLSVTDKGVLIARDGDGYIQTSDDGTETKYYNEFLIIPNNKSNLDLDLLIKKLDYVGITSALTTIITTNGDNPITITPTSTETINTDTATTYTNIEYEYERINKLLSTNILKRDLLKNYINKVYLNKINYNGKLEIYLYKKDIRKDLLKIDDSLYRMKYEELYPSETINLREELIKLQTIVTENNMENYFKNNMQTELEGVIRDKINYIFDNSLNLKKTREDLFYIFNLKLDNTEDRFYILKNNPEGGIITIGSNAHNLHNFKISIEKNGNIYYLIIGFIGYNNNIKIPLKKIKNQNKKFPSNVEFKLEYEKPYLAVFVKFANQQGYLDMIGNIITPTNLNMNSFEKRAFKKTNLGINFIIYFPLYKHPWFSIGTIDNVNVANNNLINIYDMNKTFLNKYKTHKTITQVKFDNDKLDIRERTLLSLNSKINLTDNDSFVIDITNFDINSDIPLYILDIRVKHENGAPNINDLSESQNTEEKMELVIEDKSLKIKLYQRRCIHWDSQLKAHTYSKDFKDSNKWKFKYTGLMCSIPIYLFKNPDNTIEKHLQLDFIPIKNCYGLTVHSNYRFNDYIHDLILFKKFTIEKHGLLDTDIVIKYKKIKTQIQHNRLYQIYDKDIKDLDRNEWTNKTEEELKGDADGEWIIGNVHDENTEMHETLMKDFNLPNSTFVDAYSIDHSYSRATPKYFINLLPTNMGTRPIDIVAHYLSHWSKNNHLFTNGSKESDVYDIETGATYGPGQVYTKKDSKNDPGGPLTLRFDKSPDSSRTNTDKPWNLITKTKLGFVRGPSYNKKVNTMGYQTIMTFNKNITLKYYDFAYHDHENHNSHQTIDCDIKLEYWDEDKKEWMLMHLYSPSTSRHITIPFFGYERLFNSGNYGENVMRDILTEESERAKGGYDHGATSNYSAPMGRFCNTQLLTNALYGRSVRTDNPIKYLWCDMAESKSGHSSADIVGRHRYHASVFPPELRLEHHYGEVPNPSYPTIVIDVNGEEKKEMTSDNTRMIQWAHNFAPIRPWARPCVDLRHTYIYDGQPLDSVRGTGNMLMTRRVHPQLKPSKYFRFSVQDKWKEGNPSNRKRKDTSGICFMRMYGKIHHDIILPTEREWISGGIQQNGAYTYDHRMWNDSEGTFKNSYNAVNLVGKKLKNNYYKSNKFNNLILRINSTNPKVNSENLLWNMHYNLKGEGGIFSKNNALSSTLDPYTNQTHDRHMDNRLPSFENTYKIIQNHGLYTVEKINLLYKEGNTQSIDELNPAGTSTSDSRMELVNTLAKKYYNSNFLKIDPYNNQKLEEGKSEAIYEFNSPIKLTSFDIATYSRLGVYFALYYYDEDLVGTPRIAKTGLVENTSTHDGWVEIYICNTNYLIFKSILGMSIEHFSYKNPQQRSLYDYKNNSMAKINLLYPYDFRFTSSNYKPEPYKSGHNNWPDFQHKNPKNHIFYGDLQYKYKITPQKKFSYKFKFVTEKGEKIEEPESHLQGNVHSAVSKEHLNKYDLTKSSIGEILWNPMLRFVVNKNLYIHSNNTNRAVHMRNAKVHCDLLTIGIERKDEFRALSPPAISRRTQSSTYWTNAEKRGPASQAASGGPDATQHVVGLPNSIYKPWHHGTKDGYLNNVNLGASLFPHYRGNPICDTEHITSLSITERKNDRVGAYFVRLHGESLSYPSMPRHDSGLAVINSKNTNQTKKIKVNYIKDKYGTWIKVGMFSNDTHRLTTDSFSIINEIKKSVKVHYNLSTNIHQETPTAFSADFGELPASEVRILGATDFDRWEETRTIDWVYKVPQLSTNIKLYKEYSFIHKMSGINKNIHSSEYFFNKVNDDLFDGTTFSTGTPVNKTIMDISTIDRYTNDRLYKTKSYNFGDPEKNEYMVIDFDITLNEDIGDEDRPTLCFFGGRERDMKHQYTLYACSEDGIQNTIKLESSSMCNNDSGSVRIGYQPPENATFNRKATNLGISLELNKTYNVKVVIQCRSNSENGETDGFDISSTREVYMYLDNELLAKNNTQQFIVGTCPKTYAILHKDAESPIYFRFGGVHENLRRYNIKNITFTPRNIYMANILQPYANFTKKSKFYLYDKSITYKQGTAPTSYYSTNPPENNNNINTYGTNRNITNDMINMIDDTGNIDKINSTNALDLETKSNGLILIKGHPFFTTVTSPDNFSRTNIKITGVINMDYKDLLANIPKILITNHSKEVEKEINYDKTSGVWEVSFTLAKGIYDIQIKQKINNSEGVTVIEQEYLSKIGINGLKVSTAKHKKWKNFFKPKSGTGYRIVNGMFHKREPINMTGFDIAGAYDCRGRWNYDEDIFLGLWDGYVSHSSSAYNNEGEIDFFGSGRKGAIARGYGLGVPGNGSIYGTTLRFGVTSGFGCFSENDDTDFFIDYNSEIEELPFSAMLRNGEEYNSAETWDSKIEKSTQSQPGGGQTYNMVKYIHPRGTRNPNYKHRYLKASAVWVLLKVDEHIQDLDFRILQEGEDVVQEMAQPDGHILNSMEDLVGKRVHITAEDTGAYLAPCTKAGHLMAYTEGYALNDCRFTDAYRETPYITQMSDKPGNKFHSLNKGTAGCIWNIRKGTKPNTYVIQNSADNSYYIGNQRGFDPYSSINQRNTERVDNTFDHDIKIPVSRKKASTSTTYTTEMAVYMEKESMVVENENINKDKEWYLDGLTTTSNYDKGKYWFYFYASPERLWWEGGIVIKKNKVHNILNNPSSSIADKRFYEQKPFQDRNHYNFKLHVLGNIIEQPPISSIRDLIGKVVLIKNQINNAYAHCSYSDCIYEDKDPRTSWNKPRDYLWQIEESPLGDDFVVIRQFQYPDKSQVVDMDYQIFEFFAGYAYDTTKDFNLKWRHEASGIPGVSHHYMPDITDKIGLRKRNSIKVKAEWKVGTSTSTTFTTKMKVYVNGIYYDMAKGGGIGGYYFDADYENNYMKTHMPRNEYKKRLFDGDKYLFYLGLTSASYSFNNKNLFPKSQETVNKFEEKMKLTTAAYHTIGWHPGAVYNKETWPENRELEKSINWTFEVVNEEKLRKWNCFTNKFDDVLDWWPRPCSSGAFSEPETDNNDLVRNLDLEQQRQVKIQKLADKALIFARRQQQAQIQAQIQAESSLYEFTSHTFTHCGDIGIHGPTLKQMKSAYSGTSWVNNVDFFDQRYYQGYQTWTVPKTGNYRIKAYGAAGGLSHYELKRGLQGKGAWTQGFFKLTKGTKLLIIVGQQGSGLQGGHTTWGGASGGGATWVLNYDDGVKTSWALARNLYCVAGGGGGGSEIGGNDGSTNSDAGKVQNDIVTNWNSVRSKGTTGWHEGGGASYGINGGGGPHSNLHEARNPKEGSSGGYNTSWWCEGGFGGGGTAGAHASGGGGGYVGGDGSGIDRNVGGNGGSSRNNGTFPSFDNHTNSNGSVEITLLSNVGTFASNESLEEKVEKVLEILLAKAAPEIMLRHVQNKLYEFTSHTFTTCGAMGRFGPTFSQMKSGYSGTSWVNNVDFFNSDIKGYQQWTVPQTGKYKIKAYGAKGGISGIGNDDKRGLGAWTQGDFNLTKGTKLTIIVGQRGQKSTKHYPQYPENCGGGGGATWVLKYEEETGAVDRNLYCVAGGGGGELHAPYQNNSIYRTNPKNNYDIYHKLGIENAGIVQHPIVTDWEKVRSKTGPPSINAGGGGSYGIIGGTHGVAYDAYSAGCPFKYKGQSKYKARGGRKGDPRNGDGGFGGGGGSHSVYPGGGGGYVGGSPPESNNHAIFNGGMGGSSRNNGISPSFENHTNNDGSVEITLLSGVANVYITDEDKAQYRELAKLEIEEEEAEAAVKAAAEDAALIAEGEAYRKAAAEEEKALAKKKKEEEAKKKEAARVAAAKAEAARVAAAAEAAKKAQIAAEVAAIVAKGKAQLKAYCKGRNKYQPKCKDYR